MKYTILIIFEIELCNEAWLFAGDLWNFLRLILDLSMQILAADGKYYTQVKYKTMMISTLINNR